MNKQQATDLIRTTFENAFDEERYLRFLRELFNGQIDESEERKFDYYGQYIPDSFKEYVRRYKRLGTYTDPDGQAIDLLIVILKRESSLERARTMQRNFAAYHLKRRDKETAVIAYTTEEQSDWRFSMVRREPVVSFSEAGNLIARDELTPVRRFSFLVGQSERSHTAQQQLFPILLDAKNDPTLNGLQEAFNIETVTKEFFEKYRDLFIRTKAELDKAVAANPKAQADFAAKGVDTVNLAKKLLGQIIFLYYLQKKGWFGVPRDGEWGDGSKQFLRELFAGQRGAYTNFFNDILEHLFYDALRNDRSHDDHYYGRFNCRIPFLNGGLFDPMGNYDWVRADILLPNDLFSNQNQTKEGDTGDGILDIFDRYNFTVQEDEPFEKEVAIDPELLGKAYEKFNAIRPDNYAEFVAALASGKKGEESKFNKQYGVYYTPREIVHYMCRQSLIHYLATQMGERVSQADLTLLIEQGENWRENDARVVKEGRETDTYSFIAPAAIRENAALLDEKLAAITVCDPAVGSGAFPVGMMSEIVGARQTLSAYLPDLSGFPKPDRSLYAFKRACIEHSLYGVDIDPGAVEIAKLRLWLSLIVDEEDIRQIKPLPNLDYKIVCGNSLIGFPDSYQTGSGQEIERLIRDHFHETHPTRKEQLKQQIDEKINARYAGSLKALGYQVDFDFRTVFAEVFQRNGGFDVVIGNPPYIDSETMVRKDPSEREKIAKMFQTTKGNWDLYIPFWEKAINLMSHGGTASLITPNKWLSISYGKTLRQFSKGYVYHLVDYSKFRAFDEAGVFAVVVFMSKQRQKKVRITSFIDKSDVSFDLSLSTEAFDKFENWGAFLSQHFPLVVQLLENKLKLGKVCDVEEPFTVSEAYALSDILVEEDKAKGKSLRFVNTGTIEPYFTLWGIRLTTYLKNKYVKPVVPEAQMKEKFPRRYAQSKDKKIIISGIRHFECFLDDQGEWVAGKSTVILRNFHGGMTLKYILGILNSSLVKFFLRECYSSLGMDGGINFSPSNVSQIPIPDISDKRPIELLVNQILAAKQANPQADTRAWEAEIDRLVYALYGLTEAEIAIVEGRA